MEMNGFPRVPGFGFPTSRIRLRAVGEWSPAGHHAPCVHVIEAVACRETVFRAVVIRRYPQRSKVIRFERKKETELSEERRKGGRRSRQVSVNEPSAAAADSRDRGSGCCFCCFFSAQRLI